MRKNTNIAKPWRDHIEKKVSVVPKGKSVIFYTDAHEGDVHEGGMGKGCYESLALVDYTSQVANIKHVIYGGDVLGSEKTIEDAKKYMDKFLADEGGLYDRFGSNAMFNIGNHDTNCVAWGYTKANKNGFDPTKKLADLLITESFIYERYFKPMEASGNVAYDRIGIKAMKQYFQGLSIKEFRDAFSFLGYDRYMELSDDELREYFIRETEAMFQFHYTYTDQGNKVKYIAIDCGANGPMQYGIIKQDYTDIFQIQFYWLAYELMQTPEGYDIIVMSHMLGDNPTKGCPYIPGDLYRNLDQQIYDMTNVTAPIYSVLSAYKGAKKVALPDSSHVQENNTVLKGLVEAIAEAYTSTDNRFLGGCADFRTHRKTGKVLTICGHWHHDRLFCVSEDMTVKNYEGEKIADQIPVIFTAACSIKRKSRELNMSAEVPHSSCFDILTLTEDKVVITRIGEGEDREILY